MRNLLIVIAAAVVWLMFFRTQSVTLGPGVSAPDVPMQENISNGLSHTFKGYTITPLARFEVKAKVLAKKNYYIGKESDLSPVDLALGWGNMSDESILAKINISQSGRWYKWHTQEMPIPRRELEMSSANMHIIPANSSVEADLEDVRVGDVIELSGSLVRVEDETGWRWKSSLTRNDVGGRACELIFVESFNVVSF